MGLAEMVGTDLGSRTVAYEERDAILYALAVGAAHDDLPLVFERDLRVLPTFALPLGLWVADAAGAAGAFTPERSLHGSQTLQVHAPLPRRGSVEVRGRIAAAWDKGRAAILDVVAESEYFSATYSIFLPGQGGWGGDPGPRSAGAEVEGPERTAEVATDPGQATLYRLTGDRHLIHIDPEAAKAAGFPGPILHGLATLGVAARKVAALVGAQPWELTTLSARFSGPVTPGDRLALTTRGDAARCTFAAAVGGTAVLSAGEAAFG
ncbi:MaoC/PaaZ C-terminal domain-containing protein [Pseudonocardia lutea]|uniref:MaoC/PaaZ C-terminal domain-containing protein n=1 Tax=Pseudonocardia lutea TaxID=2172015 RepID=A0ABW1I9T9_9PSEU